MAQWPSASKRVPRVPVCCFFPWQHKCDASSAVASCGVERFLLVKMLNYRNAHYSREKMFECRMNFPPRAGLSVHECSLALASFGARSPCVMRECVVRIWDCSRKTAAIQKREKRLGE